MAEANERYPDHLGVLYSTACWEALAAARRRLGDAPARVELDPRAREWALSDADLTAIHDRL